MTNMADEDFEARLRAVLQADAARAPARSPLAVPAGAGRVRRPAHRRLRLAVAGGLAVVMAAAASAGLGLTGGSRAPVTAAELLARVAAVSAAQPVPRNDQYIYVETTGIAPVSPGSDKTTRYTAWAWSPVDRKGGNLFNQEPCPGVSGGTKGPGPLSCGYRIEWMSPTFYRLPNGSIVTLEGSNVKPPKGAKQLPTLPHDYAAARALPTTAQQLDIYLKNLPDLSGGSNPIWVQLTELLEFVPVLPPKVAAAVFTLASQQPRITLLRHVTDAAGRPGIGISQAGDRWPVQLIFDPATYQLEGINGSSSSPVLTPLGPLVEALTMAILHTAIVNSEPSS
jgi:hypothetical protein